MKNIGIIVSLCWLMLGCASSDVDLAADGDWYQIGYSDGVKGRTQRSHKMLSELGQVHQAEYDQGYLAGLDSFCNPNHAYQIGLSGTYYEGVCEGREDAQKFRMEWQRGWDQSSTSN